MQQADTNMPLILEITAPRTTNVKFRWKRKRPTALASMDDDHRRRPFHHFIASNKHHGKRRFRDVMDGTATRSRLRRSNMDRSICITMTLVLVCNVLLLCEAFTVHRNDKLKPLRPLYSVKRPPETTTKTLVPQIVHSQNEVTPTTNHDNLPTNDSIDPFSDVEHISTRRYFFGSSIIAASTALLGCDPVSAAVFPNQNKDTTTSTKSTPQQQQSRLQWQVTPVNKRTGVTVYDAERAGYRVNFVTYLSRFLLTFDTDCQRWWYNRASDIPRTATSEQVIQYRNAQFAAFSASVEVGLQEYRGPDGPEKLLLSLIGRYGPDAIPRDGFSSDPSTRARQERESREARRQICLLFGLMEQNQPVAALTKQLAAIDNGSIRTVVIADRGSGYAPGYGSPQVRFPSPEAGEGYETATGRAVLMPNGKILRIDVVNRGNGYSKPPIVYISPPAAVRFSDSTSSTTTDFAEAAEALAYIFRSGPNKGRIQRIELTKPGAGYTLREIIRIRIDTSDTTPQEGGITATATAVLEYEVSDIMIINNGTGYAVEKPIRVFVEPPPLTARVNMNDPMLARIIAPDEPLPATAIPSPELRKKMPDLKDPKSIAFQANFEASKGGGGGCIGRACYDRPVRAVAFASSDSKNVFDSFRQTDDDPLRSTNKGLEGVDLQAATLPPQRIVSASDSTGDIPEPINFISGSAGASSELLNLLPAGVGLEFNALYNRYELAVDPNYENNSPLWMRGYSSARKIDPDFGPRGRAPIERDMQLGISSYLRFLLSGAICCSGVHLVLTPIDGEMTQLDVSLLHCKFLSHLFLFCFLDSCKNESTNRPSKISWNSSSIYKNIEG